jgi:hypothetical protein
MGIVQNPYFARPIYNFIAWEESTAVRPDHYVIIGNTVRYEGGQRVSGIGQRYNRCYTPQRIQSMSHHVPPYFGVTPDGSQITIYTQRGFVSFGRYTKRCWHRISAACLDIPLPVSTEIDARPVLHDERYNPVNLGTVAVPPMIPSPCAFLGEPDQVRAAIL